MREQKQIEEMVKVIGNTWIIDLKAETKGVCEVLDEIDIETIARKLYEQDYRKVPDGAIVLTPEERDEKMKEIDKAFAKCDELQELNIKYYNEAKDLRRKVVDIEAENERLSAKLGQILLSIDTVKEMNAMCKIDDHRKQAVKEFGDKIKAKLFSVFGKTICSDLDTEDIADIIDEVLKEV